MAEITSTMQAALDYIRQEGGGAVERLEGGFWMKAGAKFCSGDTYVKTATVNALEKRGLVEIAYPNRRPRATLTATGIKATNWTPTAGEDVQDCAAAILAALPSAPSRGQRTTPQEQGERRE